MVVVELKAKVKRFLGRCFLELPKDLYRILRNKEEVQVVLLFPQKHDLLSSSRNPAILCEPKIKGVFVVEFMVSGIKNAEDMESWLLILLRHLKDPIQGLGYRKQTIVKERDYFKAIYVKYNDNKVIIEAKRKFPDPETTIWEVTVTQEIITDSPLTRVQELASSLVLW